MIQKLTSKSFWRYLFRGTSIKLTRFLKQLVSNKYFPQYEKQMIKELNDKYAWNDKCWNLLQFF